MNFACHCGVKQHWIEQSSLRILRQVLCGGDGGCGSGGFCGDGGDFRGGGGGHSCCGGNFVVAPNTTVLSADVS